MAFSSRLLSKSKQLYGFRVILQQDHAVPVRYYAKETFPRVDPNGDKVLKDIFLEVKNKYEAAISILRKEKITIAPEDPVAISRYASVMKMIREKAGFLSPSERIKNNIVAKTKDIQDARTYVLALQKIRVEQGLTDDLGIEPLMIDAVDRIEKDLKKPLMRADKKGMTLLQAEFDKINKKVGICKEDLPKYEEELELNVAKAQLEELKKDVVEAMDTQLRREEFADEERVDPKTLDIRNFI